jgi:hypothetical protein
LAFLLGLDGLQLDAWIKNGFFLGCWIVGFFRITGFYFFGFSLSGYWMLSETKLLSNDK